MIPWHHKIARKFDTSFVFAGVLGVDIRELSVPKLVELGSENVVLDCDYDYDEREKMELDIKWYFNDSPSPFFQWVPGQLKRPQVSFYNSVTYVCFTIFISKENIREREYLRVCVTGGEIHATR